MSTYKPMPFAKYQAFRPVKLADRTWPDQHIEVAPRWCTVDLRDGNQALIEPMSPTEKMRLYQLLLNLNFKEIEVGFPAASETDFAFVREIIEQNLIPDDVTIQVLTQARPELIKRTLEGIAGAKNVILHLYNSTSPLQREVVFRMEKQDVIKLATDAVELIKDAVKDFSGNITLEYSPESYSGTEVDFAVEICEAVMAVWQPTIEDKIILNLPGTVEMTSPNIYADQIEYFIRQLKNRDCAVISLHTHNDRGTGVAATELGLMAGADRVEGTLFGNGERTGNADLITLAMNMFSQGVDPTLYLAGMPEIVEVSNAVTKIPVHVRQPYAGELVFTAFSGSHQDAIKKGMGALGNREDGLWQVPYLPIDPEDVGTSYRETVRVNSQSGKGGVAYILENYFGVTLSREMLVEFSKTIQARSEAEGGELKADEIWQSFEEQYIGLDEPYRLVSYTMNTPADGPQQIVANIAVGDNEITVEGEGNGPIDAFVSSLQKVLNEPVNVRSYQEYALEQGKEAKAICLLSIEDTQGNVYFGAGVNSSTLTSSFEAVVSATNRKLKLS